MQYFIRTIYQGAASFIDYFANVDILLRRWLVAKVRLSAAYSPRHSLRRRLNPAAGIDLPSGINIAGVLTALTLGILAIMGV